jgi:hypothetical protein
LYYFKNDIKKGDGEDITWSTNPGAVEMEWMRSQHGSSSVANGSSSLTRANPSSSSRRTSRMVEAVSENLKKFKPLFARHEIKDPLHSLDFASGALVPISETSFSSSSPQSPVLADKRNLSSDPMLALIQVNNLQQQANSNLMNIGNHGVVRNNSSDSGGGDEMSKFMRAENMRIKEEGLWLIVEEELCPPEDALAIIQNFTMNCLVPKLEEAFRIHEIKCMSLLKAAAPNKHTSNGHHRSSAVKTKRTSSLPLPPNNNNNNKGAIDQGGGEGVDASAQPVQLDPTRAATHPKWSMSRAISNSMPSVLVKQSSSFFNLGSSSHGGSMEQQQHSSHGSSGNRVDNDLFGGLERKRLYDDLKNRVQEVMLYNTYILCGCAYIYIC